MECSCVRQTDLPHTTRLFADLVYHPDRLKPYYFHTARSLDACAAAAREVELPDKRRAALVEALRPLNPGSAALEMLAEPGTVAVVTGQQVGLFSGPSYTIYKALTAIRLAAELSARGTPAVPVFWLATEDHDFDEVNHASVFDAAHHPIKLGMRRAAQNQPVGEVALNTPPVAELREALREMPFAAETVAMVERAYAHGRTMGAAFSALLKDLLAGFDLVHIDPMAPAVRALAAPTLQAAVEAAPDLTERLLERNRELNAAGYHAQVHVEPSTSLVFLLENGRRLALRRQNSEYVLNGRRLTTSELSSRAVELSPNALLRPVVQDAMLPTAAYVGGPAELAYLAQAEVIYRRLLGRMPVPFPRSGFTLLDARCRKLMERYRLCLTDFFHGEEKLRERMAERLVPPTLSARLDETKAAVESAVGRLHAELEVFDPTLAAAAERSRRKMLYQVAKTERKIGREMLARNERAGSDAAYLYGLVYPERHLQERIYTILPFLARHGLDLPERLYEAVRLDCPEHQLVSF
jgi:bacillithiol biosynthesis cysteine-adding enzyme BshC